MLASTRGSRPPTARSPETAPRARLGLQHTRVPGGASIWIPLNCKINSLGFVYQRKQAHE